MRDKPIDKGDKDSLENSLEARVRRLENRIIPAIEDTLEGKIDKETFNRRSDRVDSFFDLLVLRQDFLRGELSKIVTTKTVTGIIPANTETVDLELLTESLGMDFRPTGMFYETTEWSPSGFPYAGGAYFWTRGELNYDPQGRVKASFWITPVNREDFRNGVIVRTPLENPIRFKLALLFTKDMPPSERGSDNNDSLPESDSRFNKVN